jgi:hypothetical protein
MAWNGKRAGRLPDENAAATGHRGGNSGLLDFAGLSSPLLAHPSALHKSDPAAGDVINSLVTPSEPTGNEPDGVRRNG